MDLFKLLSDVSAGWIGEFRRKSNVQCPMSNVAGFILIFELAPVDMDFGLSTLDFGRMWRILCKELLECCLNTTTTT